MSTAKPATLAAAMLAIAEESAGAGLPGNAPWKTSTTATPKRLHTHSDDAAVSSTAHTGIARTSSSRPTIFPTH